MRSFMFNLRLCSAEFNLMREGRRAVNLISIACFAASLAWIALALAGRCAFAEVPFCAAIWIAGGACLWAGAYHAMMVLARRSGTRLRVRYVGLSTAMAMHVGAIALGGVLTLGAPWLLRILWPEGEAAGAILVALVSLRWWYLSLQPIGYLEPKTWLPSARLVR